MKKVHNRHNEDFIKSLYERNLNGELLKDIATSIGRHYTTLSKVFRNHGFIPIKHENAARRDKIIFNEKYFDIIDTEIKAYFLGLIYADGYITTSKKDYYTFGIALKESDRHILELLKEELKWPRDLYYSKNTKSYKLVLSTKPIVMALLKLGVKFNKSYKELSIPKIDKKLLPCFIKGVFDGDGSYGVYISNKRKSINVVINLTCSSEIFIDELQKYLFSLNIESTKTIVNRNIKNSNHINLYILHINKTISQKMFIEKIYNSFDIGLYRKKEKIIHANTVLNKRTKKLLSA